jgi:NAD(P)-dependent dehydrogenase (short-subunit alcohol dehydrogenase family)
VRDAQNITGKIVLITGASTGIGRASADRLAAAGATVVGAHSLKVTCCFGCQCFSEKFVEVLCTETEVLGVVTHVRCDAYLLPSKGSVLMACSHFVQQRMLS